MHDLLNRNTFVVKEHVGLFKAANNFDILDPDSGEIVLECREENLSLLSKIFRFTDYKRMTPFDIRIQTPDGRQIVRVRRGMTLFRSRVEVLGEHDQHIGGLVQKMLSIGGAFQIHDAQDQPVCSLKGKWTGWNFKFVSDEQEYAQVTKKWNGLGKELLTSADSYVVNISDSVAPDTEIRSLILASVMCIDMVLKE